MKKTFKYIVASSVCIIAVALIMLQAACTSTSSTVHVPSDDPTVASMTFAANDSIPALASAVFTVEDRIDTGMIYNVDSLAYGTLIDKVVPRFKFNASAVSAAIIYTATDTIALSGSDTIDFTTQPVLLNTISETGTVEKWYKIYVNVHQANPDLYKWDRIADNIVESGYSSQNAVMLNDTIYLFASNGLQSKALRSTEGVTWEATEVPFADFDVQNTVVHNGKIYCLHEGQLKAYTAGDGWKNVATDNSIERLVCSFNGKMWAIQNEGAGGEYSLVTSAGEGTDWEKQMSMPQDFPVSDFSVITFLSPTGRQRAMIVGGYNKSGTSLNTRWNVEYDKTRGYRWENFSIEQPNFKALTGVSIVYYDKHFFMFGGVDADNNIGEYNILESYDEGMNWSVPDTAHNSMPNTYKARAHQSAVVSSQNYIYIIGGKSRTEVFTDVFRGQLNSINW